MENRRIKMTKKLLTDALTDLLKGKSVADISVKELCEKADINRSTFYAHYSTITELVEDIKDEYIKGNLEFLYSLGDGSQEATEKMYRYLEYLKDNKEEFFMLASCSSLVEDINGTLYKSAQEAYEKNVAPISKEFEPYFGAEVDFMLYGFNYLVGRWLVDGCKYPAKYVVESFKIKEGELYNMLMKMQKEFN